MANNNLVTNFEDITVGAIINNTNGDDYVVVAINAKQDRTLLIKQNAKELYYVGAWALQKASNREGWYWGQGHYFGSNLEGAMKYVLDIEDKQKEVWLVKKEWATDNEESSETHVCDNYKTAKKLFDEAVNEDKYGDYEGYDNEDSPYQYETSDNYWAVWEKDNYCLNRSEITLEKYKVEDK